MKTNIALIVLIVACGIALGGCTGPGLMSSVTSDMKDLLKDPVVQKTLQSWAANADVTNPSVGFRIINGGELYFSGVIVRGTMTGGGTIQNAASAADASADTSGRN